MAPEIIDNLLEARENAAETVAYQTSLLTAMAMFGNLMPGLQKMAKMLVEEAVENESRLETALEILEADSPFALQKAQAALQGLPSDAVNPWTGEVASIH